MAGKSDDKTPQQKMAEAIGTIVYGAMQDTTSIYTGVVKSISGKKAVVTMNGQDQNVAVISPQISKGTVSRIFVPDGNMSNAFILGSASSDDGTTLPTVQIATGSYSGEGTYGSSNKRTLTFNFEPKYVFVTNTTSGDYGFASFIYGSDNTICQYGDRQFSVIVIWSGKSISWYGTSSAGKQLNLSGDRYFYFAIGT